MNRKYKLLLIIIISSLLAYLIYTYNKKDYIRMVAVGDGISSGMTIYNIKGISYNDYIKDYLNVNDYNNFYSQTNYTLDSFLEDLTNNDVKEKFYLKQIINKANIITISFGEEELSKRNITNDLNIEFIKEFIKSYDLLFSNITNISEADIYIIGLYENNYLSNTNVILINSAISNLAKKYGVNFININDLIKEDNYLFNRKSIYFNYKAHKKIADMILNSKSVAL